MKILSTFDGHLVLWCKGHYTAEKEVSLFDELKRIWAIRCGLDFEHVDNYSFEYIANRLYKILVACEPQKEKYIHELIHKELTSSIGYPDNLTPIQKLIWINRSQIGALQIYDINGQDKKTLIDLPNSQFEIFKRITNGGGEYGDYDKIVKLDERNLEDSLDK
jgi:hypothetical protein